jgi:hypothetical protein
MFPAPLPSPKIQSRTYSLPHSIVHTLTIPIQSGFRVVPAIANSVAPLKTFAQREGAIAAINAGFFDPTNQQSTSFVMRDGRVVADPRQNERLTQNPNLAPYLDQIFNRSELRRYQCGSVEQYAIALRSASIPAGCELVNALGGGPRLLPDLTATSEGFLDTANGQVIRDPIGINRPNARTAIGLTPTGEMIWVMVAQQPERPGNSGMSLPDLANFMKNLGVDTALNLDGGSSSSLYYNGTTVYGKVNARGAFVERPVKSVLLVQNYP